MSTGGKMVLAALLLLVAGAALPFLMVLGMLESTWLLNSFTYICQVAGLVVGFIGIGRLRAGR